VDLKVTKRENYPIKQGFPSKLRYLLVNGINLGKIDSRILALKNLQTIDLSQNSILSIEKVREFLSWYFVLSIIISFRILIFKSELSINKIRKQSKYDMV
jgi:Leucine-rich repeat (LRR) protein